MNENGFSTVGLICSLGVLLIGAITSMIIYNIYFTEDFKNEIEESEIETPKYETYSDIKNRLVAETKLYIETKYKDGYPETINNVTFDILYTAGLIDQIHDIEDDKVLCDGYVTITNNNDELEYKPYLWCGDNYKDEGYVSYLES